MINKRIESVKWHSSRIRFEILLLLLLSQLLLGVPGIADTTTKDKTAPGAVIDFEADVIQGERRKPDVFLQLGKQSQTLDSVIFMRNDFKDFHSIERNWRPSYLELKAPKARKKK